MNGLADRLFAILAGAMMLLMPLGLGISVIMPGMDRWDRRFFIAFFSVLTLASSTFVAGGLIYNSPSMIMAEKVVYFLESVFTSLPIPLLSVYLMHCCAQDPRRSMLFRTIIAFWLSYLALLIVAQFSTLFYSVTPDTQFYRGPWYPLLILPLLAIMLLNIVGVIRRRDVLSKKLFRAFLVYLLPLTAAMIVHAFVTAFLLVDMSIGLSAFAMLCIVWSEHAERYMSQQREIANQRANITVLQMRPHFIYNTMTSIYYLCEQDPKMAQQVTLDFTTYLRRNLAAIASDDTIPFLEELEHTRAYLAVEQAQFEDMLLVDYDTPHVDFRVPPLTLQPIVENAVKHGLDPDSAPLHVTIRTRKIGSTSQIVVANNGLGFDPAIADDPHTTMANIRQRLEMMCDGSLVIASCADGGATVTVTIP